MIRLPPSSIILGPSDLRDFEARQRLHRSVNALGRTTIIKKSRTPSVAVVNIHVSDHTPPKALNPKAASFVIEEPAPEMEGDVESQSLTLYTPSTEEEHLEQVTVQLPYRPYRHVAENATVEVQRTTSPPKQSFYYSGFLGSPSSNAGDNSQRSSPFDASTPLVRVPEPRGRIIPRSPLFLSQSTASPEHRNTSSLTPRVNSRVATHNTPGIIFSNPPRRSRNFRHQANSFSFDESERSSAAYEQDRVSSSSPSNSRPRPTQDRSLHEELSGSTMQDSASDISSYISSSPPSSVQREGQTAAQTTEQIIESTTIISSFTPPQLPPPFSAVSRSSSRTESLPRYSAERLPSYSLEDNPCTSPIRAPSASPTQSTPRVASRLTQSWFTRSAARILPPSRPRHPALESSHHPSISLSPSHSLTPTASLTTSQSQLDPRARVYSPQTPSRAYQVYHDGMPSMMQPQTPEQLPESRHRSRYHPSYTAPVNRSWDTSQRYSGDGASDYDNPLQFRRNFRSVTTPSRMISRISEPDSLGMSEEGFEGLYGGRENGDDRQTWADGVRTSNVRSDIWG